VLIALSAVWIFYTPQYLKKFQERRFRYFFATFGQVGLAVIAYILTIVVMTQLWPSIETRRAWVVLLAALGLFSLLHGLISVPMLVTREGGILLPPFEQQTVPAMALALMLACVWTISSLVLPPVHRKMGGIVLRAFNVGGGVPVVLCLKSKPAAQIAQRFDFGPDDCSGKLAMQLDIGDRVYVSRPALGDLDPEPVSFRQDDIRQKIYFRLTESKTPAKTQ
jgi:hypothetical protein